MIQRIQSIYLVLAGLFPAFTLFVPAAAFTGKGGEFTLSSLAFWPATGLRSPYELTVLVAAAIVLPLVAVFAYSNRKKQVKLASIAQGVNVLWYVAFAVSCITTNGSDAAYSFRLGCLFPLLALIVLFLAKKAIKRDEALIRAADRIR